MNTATPDPIHPAGVYSVADILCQLIRPRTHGWTEETYETTWRAQDHRDTCDGDRWVIVATGQLAPRDAIGGRPGPLVVAAGNGIETRIQLPYVVGQDQIFAVLDALEKLGALAPSRQPS